MVSLIIPTVLINVYQAISIIIQLSRIIYDVMPNDILPIVYRIKTLHIHGSFIVMFKISDANIDDTVPPAPIQNSSWLVL